MVYTKESIRSLLKDNVLEVVFIKTDGSTREMICTLQESFITPYEKKTDRKQKTESNDVLSVWDIEKHAWRSFQVGSVQTVSVVEDPINV